MECPKDYMSKVFCNAHRSILETLIATKQQRAAEHYLLGCCEKCYVTFEPSRMRFQYIEVAVYDQDGLSVGFHSFYQEIHGQVDGEIIYACHISVCVSEFLDKLAEKLWRKWKQKNDVKKYADTIGWVTVEIPTEILRQAAFSEEPM